MELTEEERSVLDGKLQKLVDALPGHPAVTLTYFQPDKRKAGGAYVTASGRLKKIDDLAGVLILMGGERIVIEDIMDIR